MPLQNPPGTEAGSTTTVGNAGSHRLSTMCETYVDETKAWVDRLETMIERYPWPTLLFALGLGYVIARRMR